MLATDVDRPAIDPTVVSGGQIVLYVVVPEGNLPRRVCLILPGRRQTGAQVAQGKVSRLGIVLR